jgi:NADPH:quinone reductase-like Zn-dependent oxidoreductase
MKAYLLRSFGGPEVLRIEDIDNPKPGFGEALIRIIATSINRADILIRSGHPEYRVKLPHILGGDVYGVVEALGEGVDWIEVGDHVIANFVYGCGRCSYCAIGLENMCRKRSIVGHTRWGSYAEYITLPARSLIKVNSFPEGRALGAAPLALVTAWRSLVTLSRIRPGHRVFIWAASGGVGTYAIQIAKLFGSEVIVSAGDREKGKKLSHIGADHIVYYREEDVVQRTMEITEGEGVDIVLNSVGGETVQKSIDMLKPGGVLVIIGVMAGSEARIMLRRAYLKGITITGTAGGNRWELVEAIEMVRRGLIKPIIYKEYSFHEIPDAHKELEAGNVVGKLLIHVSER